MEPFLLFFRCYLSIVARTSIVDFHEPTKRLKNVPKAENVEKRFGGKCTESLNVLQNNVNSNN
jgi:hypothetical protein